jgi:hypothetical protein
MHPAHQMTESALNSAGPSALDLSTQEGAQRLKAMIEAYWAARGYSVMVALQNMGFHPALRAARFEVRSDMVDGLPQSRSGSPDAR